MRWGKTWLGASGREGKRSGGVSASHVKFIFSHFTTPPIYAILNRYDITPMPGYPVTPAGSLVFGEMNSIKEETP